jgi:hypothetical protein
MTVSGKVRSFYCSPMLCWNICLLLILFMNTAFAQSGTNADASMVEIIRYMNSLKNVPEYCKCRVAEGEFRQQFIDGWPPQFAALINKWSRVFGDSYGYLHHYCFGLMRMNDLAVMQPSLQNQEEYEIKRKATLKSALEEFEFVRHSAPEASFPLWTQLFTYEFKIYIQLDQPTKARWALQEAAARQKKQ